MLVCSCIPLVYLNPSSVNLDRAVGLCGSLYTSPKPLRLLPSTYHRLMVCSPTLFALRLGHSLCVYSDNLSERITTCIHPLLLGIRSLRMLQSLHVKEPTGSDKPVAASDGQIFRKPFEESKHVVGSPVFTGSLRVCPWMALGALGNWYGGDCS